MNIQLNEIYNMDCLEGMKYIPDKSIDMVLCDLPYTFKGKNRITANSWDLPINMKLLWIYYNRIISDKGVIALTATNPFSSYLVMSNLEMFKYEWIWEKDNGSNFVHVNHQPFKVHEQVLIFGKSPTTYNKGEEYMNYNPQFTQSTPYMTNRHGVIATENLAHKDYTLIDTINEDGKRYPRSVQKFNSEHGLHPTQKPVALFEYLIKTYTNEGDTVLDNCMGSGTTAIACMNTKRNFIGFELEKKYYDICIERINVRRKELSPDPSSA